MLNVSFFYIAAREMKCFVRLYVNSVFTAESYRSRLTPKGDLSRRAKSTSAREVNRSRTFGKCPSWKESCPLVLFNGRS